MKRTFIELPLFKLKWQELGLSEVELTNVRDLLLEEPNLGWIIKGADERIRKLRYFLDQKRIIRITYLNLDIDQKIYFIMADPNIKRLTVCKSWCKDVMILINNIEKELKDTKEEDMSINEDIKIGLNEVLDYEKGEGKGDIKTIRINPFGEYSPEEIKNIRLATGYTQAMFARFMGVALKTVEAWETGINHPEGAACRMLELTKIDPLFPTKSGIVEID